ncbi:hypothetical protein AGLY_008624 [Aphis glycines]|uniref:C2H2-type domain-containing protein n=1 Tax=Aphis glycines TaxID=307491 RepID=A0A6G0TKY4_APHGL|nr:hypothetical protein AGLY_008624 [Aphis glycines]
MFSCKVCQAEFMSILGINKHLRTKHEGHINTTDNNMSCSFAICSKSFHKMNGLISHLKSVHNMNIESTLLNFKNIEDFNFWKKSIEEKELCQYVKSTLSKTNEDKSIYYYCHIITIKHTHDTGKQRLFIEDRRKLALGVPINRALDDIRSSDIEGGIKIIHSLEKKIYTIKKCLIILLIKLKSTKMMQ